LDKFISDRKILELLSEKQSQEKGFRLLVEKFQERIYWHVRRIIIDHDETDDIVQETFIKIWKNILKFRKDSELYTWIYRIATNETLAVLRKNKRTRIIRSGLSTKSSEQQNEAFHRDEDLEKRFKDAVVRLPDKQRLVFNMKYFDNMKYHEIADILNTSEGALKASYHHAVKKITNYISG